MRGFCNEVFTIFGWIGAVIATIYFTPVAREYGRTLIEKKWLADIATAGAIFVVTLGVFSVVSYFATKTLAASKLNIVDRSLGFAFGVLRGIVLLGLSFYLYTYVFSDPANRPIFVQEARTRPFLEASSTWIKVFLPKDMDDTETLQNAGEKIDTVMTPVSQKLEAEIEKRDQAAKDKFKKEKETETRFDMPTPTTDKK